MGDKTTDAAKAASEQAAKDAAAAQAAKDAQALKDAALKDAAAKEAEAKAAAEAKAKADAEEVARAAEEAAAPKVITVATVVGQMVNPLTGMVFDVGDRVDVVNPDCWVLAQLDAKKLVEI